MMNRAAGFSATFFLLLLFTSTTAAFASPVWIDIYPEPGTLPGPVLLNESNWYYAYTHDIKDDGFDVGQDFVTRYDLSIGLFDDSESDRSEWAWIDLPGLITDGIVEIERYTDYERGWSIAGLISLNATGTILVGIKRLNGDFYFGESTLSAYGCEANPVPLPTSAILLGSGLLGLIAFRRRA